MRRGGRRERGNVVSRGFHHNASNHQMSHGGCASNTGGKLNPSKIITKVKENDLENDSTKKPMTRKYTEKKALETNGALLEYINLAYITRINEDTRLV